MKISIFTTSFPRWAGDDRGSFILNAARALVKQGAAVQVIAIHVPGVKRREVMDGVEVIRPMYLPEKMEILQKEGGGLPVVWKKYPLARLALIPFLAVQTFAAAFYGRKSDVIHANWTLSGAIAWFSRFLHRRPYVVTVHGSDLYQTVHMGWARFVSRLSLSSASRVIAVSHDLARMAIELGVPEEKIQVIPDGIDVDQFIPGSDSRENIILYVGSLIPRKGVTYLIQALPRILEACPNARLVIAGQGPLADELKQEARNCQVESRVDFLGAISQGDVSAWMRKAKVFVLPSYEEGLGVVLLEAIASGTPCVASAIGGIPDIVSPQVGVLVPPKNPQELAAGVIRVLQSPEDWQSYSQAARRRAVDEFSWTIISRRLMQVYQEAASGAKS